MDKIKYLDTYVLCEISKANTAFSKYLTTPFVINELTLTEFYGVILREYDEATADYWYRRLLPYAKQISLAILIKAIKFKIKHNKQEISFFDAAGYVFAAENKMLFVTGDKEFKSLPYVEFVNK